MIFGMKPIIEAIDSGKEIDKILLKKGLEGESQRELRALINSHKIPFQIVPFQKLDNITRKNHQGVVAFISLITYQDIENIIPQIYERGKDPLILILDKITDVRNFGAIARTAVCSGVDAILIPQQHAAQINEDAVKTSAVGLFKIAVCREPNLKTTIRFLKDSGLQIVACTEKGAEEMYNVDFVMPTAIIMGAEDVGISNEYIKLSDHKVKIPILGDIDSLNVSVSAGVILYEAVRQRSGNSL
ncbi:MAG: 23S rRNA (guanosine(2251)-2'-O)-methyltransferase RlmB [Bacteroidia bacterium]|nr:23S rRNA (guanosine(2251)-2'-O)-methyltransferase RlmB [Bacteroidia bacterium]